MLRKYKHFLYFHSLRFGISFSYTYLCRQLTVSRPLQRLGFTGIRCESGTVPAAVSPLATVCLLHSLATDFIVGKAQ